MFEYQDINMYVRILTSLPACKYLYVDLTRKVERIEQELKTYTDELNVLRKYKVHRFWVQHSFLSDKTMYSSDKGVNCTVVMSE